MMAQEPGPATLMVLDKGGGGSIAPSRRFVRLHPADNVVVAVVSLPTGTALASEGVTVTRAVPMGHKVATRPFAKGEAVQKFGQIIGYATQDIPAGAHVHVHNCAMGEHDQHYEIGVDYRPVQYRDPREATFKGLRRADGRVGTRNFIALCSTVNCSATVIRQIADRVNRSGVLDAYPHIDGVIALAHGTGCGIADSGEGFDALERVLWGHATHPNVTAAIFVGLGCEVMQIGRLKSKYGFGEGHFHTLTIQESGGTRKTIEAATRMIEEILPTLPLIARTDEPAAELMVALECGGSDGYSGITANPALGRAADILVQYGGTAVLAETPEIYGAEQLLVRRAASKEVGEKLIARIRWWEDYTRRNKGDMNNNPSPGNKAGGLTTILEKSLGAAAKAGTSPLADVALYAEKITSKGLVFMDSPGYDPAATTGQIASGCHLVCFTTGRGSAFGSKPAPTIKLATNSRLYQTMEEDMDINCGDIVDGDATIESKGEEIFAKILAVASGERSKSEMLGLGDNEFVPWQIGATM
jgi:altronate hydrolase